MTSGASAAATVPRLSRMSPKFLVTTLIVAPFVAAQSFATFVTAAVRSESVQITIVGPALWDATADVAATAAIAATTPRSAHMRLSEFCINSPSRLGDIRLRAGWGQAIHAQQTYAELGLDKLTHRPHAAVAQVVNIVGARILSRNLQVV